MHLRHKKHKMGLKEKLLENKRLNEENQFKVAEYQSELAYQLGFEFKTDVEVDYDYLYDPFIREYADLQLKLNNGTSQSPTEDRRKVKNITDSVDVIKTALTNVMSNTEVWNEAVQRAGVMGGVDMMGTQNSRFKAINILSDNLNGLIQIKAVDDDINKLAWEIYDENAEFVEIIFLNKLNKLSENQEMFISIPDSSKDNQDLKKLSSEIFESKQIGKDPENSALTGGVTENYRKIKSDGELELITKPLRGNMVQDFYIIDKEAIANSMQFSTEMNKIAAGILGGYDSSDGAIAFNNNILSTATDHYIEPGKALRPKDKKRFQEDYKEWFLEKEIGNQFPFGEPRMKEQIVKKEEKEEAVAVEEQQVQEQMV